MTGTPTLGWTSIGTVVGNTSTGEYSFILRSLQAKLGDIVATRVEVPGQRRRARSNCYRLGPYRFDRSI